MKSDDAEKQEKEEIKEDNACSFAEVIDQEEPPTVNGPRKSLVPHQQSLSLKGVVIGQRQITVTAIDKSEAQEE